MVGYGTSAIRKRQAIAEGLEITEWVDLPVVLSLLHADFYQSFVTFTCLSSLILPYSHILLRHQPPVDPVCPVYSRSLPAVGPVTHA